MKFKKVISLLLAVLLLSSMVAYGEAFRVDYRRVKEVVSNVRANDIYYQDFTSAEPGGFPVGVTVGTSAGGYATTAMHDVGGGVVKNCLESVDTDYSTASSGAPTVSLPVGAATGLVGVEYRMKFEQTHAEHAWNSIIVLLQGDGDYSSRITCGSGTGALMLNGGGGGETTIDSKKIIPGEWYSIKYVIDFDNQKLDVMYTRENTKETNQFLDVDFYTTTGVKNLKSIQIRSSVKGGTWVFDYFRVSTENARMEEIELNIKKGSADPKKVPAPSYAVSSKRANIKVDNKYKFTTKAPKVVNGEVLVTAKNVATIFNMSYYITSEGEVMKKDDNMFVVASNGLGITNGTSSMNLSASCITEDNQIFIPIKDIAVALGYEFSYNAETNMVEINTAVSSSEEAAQK